MTDVVIQHVKKMWGELEQEEKVILVLVLIALFIFGLYRMFSEE